MKRLSRALRTSQNFRFRKQWIVLSLIVCAMIATVAWSHFSMRRASAANPPSGTITPSTVTPVTWMGTKSGIPPTGGGESSCDEGVNCDKFTLTISGQPADWANKRVHIQINWLLNTNDYDLYVHKGTSVDAQ